MSKWLFVVGRIVGPTLLELINLLLYTAKGILQLGMGR